MSKNGLKFRRICSQVSTGPSWAYLAAFLLISACAQQPTLQQPAAQLQPAAPTASAAFSTDELRANAKQVAIQPPSVSGDDVVCREEVRVGSHIKRTRCFNRRELDEATENAQVWLRTGGLEGSPTAIR